MQECIVATLARKTVVLTRAIFKDMSSCKAVQTQLLLFDEIGPFINSHLEKARTQTYRSKVCKFVVCLQPLSQNS